MARIMGRAVGLMVTAQPKTLTIGFHSCGLVFIMSVDGAAIVMETHALERAGGTRSDRRVDCECTVDRRVLPS